MMLLKPRSEIFKSQLDKCKESPYYLQVLSTDFNYLSTADKGPQTRIPQMKPKKKIIPTNKRSRLDDSSDCDCDSDSDDEYNLKLKPRKSKTITRLVKVRQLILKIPNITSININLFESQTNKINVLMTQLKVEALKPIISLEQFFSRQSFITELSNQIKKTITSRRDDLDEMVEREILERAESPSQTEFYKSPQMRDTSDTEELLPISQNDYFKAPLSRKMKSMTEAESKMKLFLQESKKFKSVMSQNDYFNLQADAMTQVEPSSSTISTQAGASMKEATTQMETKMKSKGSQMEVKTKERQSQVATPMKEKATQMKRQKFKSMEAQTSGEFFGESSITNALQNLTESSERELERLNKTINAQVEIIAERDFEINFSSLDMRKQREIALVVFESTKEDALIEKVRDIKLSGLTSAEKLETTKQLIFYMKDALDMKYADLSFQTFITGMDGLIQNPKMSSNEFLSGFNRLMEANVPVYRPLTLSEMSAVDVNESDINTLTNNEPL